MTDDRDRAIRLAPMLEPIADRLETYARMLRKWQAKVNLVGRSTLPEIWVRHFADSAQLASFAPLDRRWVDLGSGAGFPGMVLALLQRERSAGEMHLIESDSRKAAFLREVSRETGAGAIVHNARCEEVLGDVRPQVVASRAMADFHSLLAYSAPFVEKGAIGLFMKGRDIASELTAASIPSNFEVMLTQSTVDADSSVVRVRSVEAIPGG